RFVARTFSPGAVAMRPDVSPNPPRRHAPHALDFSRAMTAPSRPSGTWSIALAAGLALCAAAGLDRFAPAPSADVSRGSEDAFATGLEPRELVPRQGPQRWMGPS